MGMTLEEAREELARATQTEDPASQRLAEAKREFAAAQPNSPERLGQTVLSYGRRGIENLVGFPADMAPYAGEALKGGSNLLAKALRAAGIDAPGIQPGSQEEKDWNQGIFGLNRGVTDQLKRSGSEGIRKYVTNPLIGEDKFQAESQTEKYLGSIAEAAPNALGGKGILSKAMQVVGGGVGAQAGEDLTKDTRFSKYGRLIGGLAGAGPGIAMSKPGSVSGSALYDDAVKTTEGFGAKLSAGQKTNNPLLRQAEAALGGNTFNKMLRGQQEVFETGKMGEIGYPGRMATPDNLRTVRMEVGGKMDNLASNTNIPFGPNLLDDITKVADNHRMANGQPAPGVAEMRRVIIEAAADNGGYINGAAYQKINTRLRELEEASGNSENSIAFDALRQKLDDAVGRTMPPEIQKGWDKARADYRGLMDIERAKAANPAGEVTPSDMRSTLRSQNGPTAIAEETHPFAKDANAGTKVMTDTPSGSLASLGTHLGPATALAATGMGTGPSMTALAAPFVVGKMLMSPPVQAMMAPGDKLRKVLAAVLAGSTASGRMNRGQQ